MACLHIGAADNFRHHVSFGGKRLGGLHCPICREFLVADEAGVYKAWGIAGVDTLEWQNSVRLWQQNVERINQAFKIEADKLWWPRNT